MSTLSQREAPPQRRIVTIALDPNGMRARVVEMLADHRDDTVDFNIADTDPDGLERMILFSVLTRIEKGDIRAAWVEDGVTYTDPSVIAAINLLFPLSKMEQVEIGSYAFHDKIPMRTDYADIDVRVVPLAVARRYCYLAPGVVMMPSYVNLGAWVGSGTMVDTWATVGSSAQIGANTHLSGGVGIGGVLEPPGAVPVIIGEHCMIGSRSQIVEGALVEDGAVVAMGTSFAGNTRVFDTDLTELTPGVIPAWSTVVPYNSVSIPCDDRFQPRWGDVPHGPDGNLWLKTVRGVRVVERREPGQRPNKAQLNNLLREEGVIG